MRSLFVIVHQQRVASYIGGQYRRQPPLDPVWRLLHHGLQSNLDAICTTGHMGCPYGPMSHIGTFADGPRQWPLMGKTGSERQAVKAALLTVVSTGRRNTS